MSRRQTRHHRNGLYVCTAVGESGKPWTMVRVADSPPPETRRATPEDVGRADATLVTGSADPARNGVYVPWAPVAPYAVGDRVLMVRGPTRREIERQRARRRHRQAHRVRHSKGR